MKIKNKASAWTNQSQPYLEAQDAWFRQCNFLSSLDLLNFNLLDQQLGYQLEKIITLHLKLIKFSLDLVEIVKTLLVTLGLAE